VLTHMEALRQSGMPDSCACDWVCVCACVAGVMSVEHVRVWQRPGAINVGCDPSAVTANGKSFRTAEYISCNRDLYVPESEQGQWRFTYCSAFQSQVCCFASPSDPSKG
jgi:hypothetical protein